MRCARLAMLLMSTVALLGIQQVVNAQVQQSKAKANAVSPPPIIDVHLHANTVSDKQIPGCVPRSWLQADGKDMSECSETIESALTNDEMMTRTLALLERYNIVGVLSGDDINLVRRWKAAAPDRIIRSAIDDPPDSIRQWAASGSIKSLGEMGFQYLGLSGNDSMPESYFALAEELDLPIGVHVGLGPPGAPYMAGLERYRMRLSNPLLLEDALVRHPKMRLYVMHAGWPMLDEMIGLLYAHPQVYVDVGVIDWAIPRAEFYTYLRRLVEAGFSKRIMFGSDEMIWPDAIPIAINSIQAAPFLSAEQKRDILYNNAVRFLRIGKRNGVATSSR